MDYQVRIVGSSGQGSDAAVDLEISATSGTAKRVFIVLDLSDSCLDTFQSVAQLRWLWKSLPPQWRVSFHALSRKDALFPSSDSLFVRDVEQCIADMKDSPELEEQRASHRLKGSFLRYPLAGIVDILQDEAGASGEPADESLVFVLTDGSLLDLAPLRLPAGMTVIGIRVQSRPGTQSRWAEILADSPLIDQGATALAETVRRVVSPGSQVCDVTPSFGYVLKDDAGLSGSRSSASRTVRWDFGKRTLVLTVPANVVADASASIDCRPEKGGTARLTLAHLASAGAAVGVGDADDTPSASLGNRRLTVVEDVEFCEQLLVHLRERAAKSSGIDDPVASRLRTLAGVRGDGDAASSSGAACDPDAAIVIALPGGVGAVASAVGGGSGSANRPILVVAGLRKGTKELLRFTSSSTVPDDPGFAASKDLRVGYDIESARWHLFSNGVRRTLPPKACESWMGLFLDREGRACEAYYTGPLASKKTSAK
jgi:hypothetical protein